MKRTIAMLGAALVLLLLASGFMAADNIRLSGEKAALTDKFNDQGYQYSLMYHQLQSAKQQIDELTRERDELRLELQDYQPGKETGEAAPSVDDMVRAADEPLPEDAASPAEEAASDEAAEDVSDNPSEVAASEAAPEDNATEETASADEAYSLSERSAEQLAADKALLEKGMAQSAENTADNEKAAEALALPLVPAAENAMAGAVPAECEPDMAMQLEKLRQEVQALSRQVDLLKARLHAAGLTENGAGYMLSPTAVALPPAPTPDPLLMDNMFRDLQRLPDLLRQENMGDE